LGVSVGLGVLVGVDVSVGVAVSVGTGVFVGGSVLVGVGVSVGTGVLVGMDVLVGTGVKVAVAPGQLGGSKAKATPDDATIASTKAKLATLPMLSGLIVLLLSQQSQISHHAPSPLELISPSRA
jgi:tetrahydrodipicolinate N-succinyltransferase